jgi:hypothetical protein
VRFRRALRASVVVVTVGALAACAGLAGLEPYSGGQAAEIRDRDAPDAPSIPDRDVLDAPSIPKLHSLRDDFDDGGLDTAKWTLYEGSGYTVAQVGGRIEIRNDSPSFGSGWIQSARLYDAKDSWLTVELVQPGKYSSDLQGGTWIKLKDDGGTVLVEFGVEHDNLYAMSGKGTSPTTAPYDASSMKWLRLREADGSTHWEYAAERSGAWTELEQRPSNSVRDVPVRVEIGMGAWPDADAAVTMGKMIFDNVNTD